MPPRVLVLHGPNLNLLLDLADVDRRLEERAKKLGLDLRTFQANSEGALVDALHAERTRVSGIIVNAAKLAPSAEVLAEALALVKRPAVEVVSEASARARSALKKAVIDQVSGKDAYVTALDVIATEVRNQQGRPTSMMLPSAQATMSDDETGPISKDEVKKTLGRKAAAEVTGGGNSGAKKTIGRNDGTMKLAAGALTRATVKEKISERLSGKLSPAGLATWARTQWQLIQRGAPVESGQRDRLEDVLQTLLLTASSKANDHQLIDLITQLG